MQNFTTQKPGMTGGDRLGNVQRRTSQAFRRVSERRWKQLAGLLILLWLTHSLAQLFWLLVPTPEIPAAEISANALVSTNTGPRMGDVNINELRQLSLFGAGAGAETEAQVNEPVQPLQPQIEDEAVDTKLSLVLSGIIGSSVDASARAIIADAKAQAIYGPGDEIENQRGVKVAKVLSLRVILDNNGQYESLWLYKEDPNVPRRQVRYDPPPAASRSWEGDEQQYNENDETEAAVQGPLEADQVNATSSGAVVEQISQNLSDVVAFNIHRENGQIKGYRVRPGRNPDAFNAAGLKAGDVVTGVNGTALDNPGKIMEIYRNLGQTTSASLEIERDGETVTIDVELE
ncbi:type II secretion system protein GspC [Gilvimarinus polysaccharolyticus]|uniref:type II secretion system protein GspC n=1 Tax=Gilvimarinus polysaccharolyticus TaxID=863921 RepID=UPI0006736F70|nr:type II secretion system protein GspC [Gilvimarinus polysaccharolyticus]